MSVHALRGICAAAYLGYAYGLYRQGFYPSFEGKNSANDAIRKYVQENVQKMGIKKQIEVFLGEDFCVFGSAFFPGPAGMLVSDETNPDSLEDQYEIIHELSHIKANDLTLWGSLPLIAAVFTHALLHRFLPKGSCIAGLAVGLTVFPILHRWREKAADITTLNRCSPDVHRAFLEKLRRQREPSSKASWGRRAFVYYCNGTLENRIRYILRFIGTKK